MVITNFHILIFSHMLVRILSHT